MFLFRSILFGFVTGFLITGLFTGIITQAAMISSGNTYLTSSFDRVMQYGFESGLWISVIGGFVGLWLALYSETKNDLIKDNLLRIRDEIGRMNRYD